MVRRDQNITRGGILFCQILLDEASMLDAVGYSQGGKEDGEVSDKRWARRPGYEARFRSVHGLVYITQIYPFWPN